MEKRSSSAPYGTISSATEREQLDIANPAGKAVLGEALNPCLRTWAGAPALCSPLLELTMHASPFLAVLNPNLRRHLPAASFGAELVPADIQPARRRRRGFMPDFDLDLDLSDMDVTPTPGEIVKATPWWYKAAVPLAAAASYSRNQSLGWALGSSLVAPGYLMFIGLQIATKGFDVALSPAGVG